MAKKEQKKKDEFLPAELKGDPWMKNPWIYAQVGGNLNLTQREVMLNIASQLQVKIKDFLDGRMKGERKAEPNGQLSLFTDDELSNGTNEFIIDAKDLGIRPDNYDYLEETCKALGEIKFDFVCWDEKKQCMMRHYGPLFADIAMPYEETSKKGESFKYKGEGEKRRRQGFVSIKMLNEYMKALFDMSKGYVEHIRRITFLCKRQRTPDIYIYLSKYKEVGHVLISYESLRRYLGIYYKTVEVDDPKHPGKKIKKEVENDLNFGKVCSRVLDPVKAEMDELAKSDDIDFTFTYEPRYNSSRRRGNPDEIMFRIHLSEMGKRHLHRLSESSGNSTNLYDLLKRKYNFTEAEVKKLTADLSFEQMNDLYTEVLAIGERVEKYKPKNEKAYVYVCITRFVEQITPKAEEVTLQEPPIEYGNAAKNMKTALVKFEKVLENIRQRGNDDDGFCSGFKFIAENADNVVLEVSSQSFLDAYNQAHGTEIFDEVQAVFGKEARIKKVL